MTALGRFQTILEAAGHTARIAQLDDGQTGPLVLAFPADATGRERSLFIETVPRAPDDAPDDAEIIVFSYAYPYALADLDVVPEVVRLLFLLNRLLPIGAHQFCEETLGVFMTYHLLTDTAADTPASVLVDAVGMIADFTAAHGALIERVMHGQADCQSIARDLDDHGLRLQPVFTAALG